MHNQKTILATAYAINPYKGSEDGMGWNFVLQIARFNKVIAITRINNRPHIEKYKEQFPSDTYQNITFKYFDLPYWMRFWKKGGRGAMLYYWMWQRAIPGFIKKQKLTFDITHNVNFHNDWTPSHLWKLKKPFVWGPVGHHPQIPSQFLKSYSKSYLLKEKITVLVKKLFWNASPALKKTIKHANHILCMNSEVSKVINIKSKSHSIMPSVATEDHAYKGLSRHDKFTLISAGRLLPLKGFDLTILSFASFIQTLSANDRKLCELIIVGSGPEKIYYKKLVAENKIQQNVKFIEWIERSELMKLYQQSSVFIFPSHEGAGMVVAEALSFGLPVICLDNSGPGEFIDKNSGLAVPVGNVKTTIHSLSSAIRLLHQNPEKLKQLSLGARNRFEKYFHWDRRGEKLQQIYQSLTV
jgi:glycosyltransferase involved in cell wall biosynthesis